jgi:hypothetical protein
MTQYLVAIHHPDDYDPSAEDEAMSRDIDALNDEMVAAGVRIFVGGLSPAGSFSADAALPDGTRISDYFYYYVRVSCQRTVLGYQFVYDFPGDNQIGAGSSPIRWNLQ